MAVDREVIISGLGQCSALGRDVPEFWRALVAAQSGIRPEKRLGDGLVALLVDPEASGPAERLRRALRSSILEACADAELSPSGLGPDVPVILGTNFGDVGTGGGEGDFLHTAHAVLAELRIGGEVWGVSIACASGVGVLGLAHDLVRYQGAEKVLVCAYDVVTAYNHGGLAGLRAISPDTVRPFDRRRSGTVLGEAAAALVVEDAERARAEGVPGYARLLGYGLANDAYHFTAPEPSGVGMRAAMAQALAQAGLSPGEIGHVNAHGTGTPYNDRVETLSLRRTFGEAADRVPVTSIKAAVGHTMGAAGALELIATELAVRTGIIPPTLNHLERDPECDLDYVFGAPRRAAMAAAMSNSYGLWGCNASVVVGRCGQ